MAPIKKTGTFKGKSNKLGYGGRAAQMRAQGVPAGVIGEIARKEGAAPGGPNYHGGKKAKKGKVKKKAAPRQSNPRSYGGKSWAPFGA